MTRLGLALQSKAWSGAGTSGLTPTQGHVLRILAGRGPLRLSDVAQHLGVSAPTASDSVRVLAEKGLVTKKKDPSDGRVVRLGLTRKGRRYAQETSEWPDFMVTALETLTKPEKEVLLTSIIKLIRDLQARSEIPEERMCVNCRNFRPAGKASESHYCSLLDSPLKHHQLRLDCGEHEPADDKTADARWRSFLRVADRR